jgi:hypothetical protein
VTPFEAQEVSDAPARATVPRSVDALVLELLISEPRQVAPTTAQLEALKVLADQWSAQGLGPGIWLAERLQGPVTEARQQELGCGGWWSELDLRAHALLVDPELGPSVTRLAQRDDFDLAVRVLCWAGTAKEARPVHALVARRIHDMLRQVEALTLEVVSHDGWRFQLGNGWQLEVFVRGYEFWRVDGVISPEGFVIELVDFDDGPLAELNEYEPPGDIESAVYGLGYTPTRRWK